MFKWKGRKKKNPKKQGEFYNKFKIRNLRDTKHNREG